MNPKLRDPLQTRTPQLLVTYEIYESSTISSLDSGSPDSRFASKVSTESLTVLFFTALERTVHQEPYEVNSYKVTNNI